MTDPYGWYWILPSKNNGSAGVYFSNIPPNANIVGFQMYCRDSGVYGNSLGSTKSLIHITDSFGQVVYSGFVDWEFGETVIGGTTHHYWYTGTIFIPKILNTGSGISLGFPYKPGFASSLTGNVLFSAGDGSTLGNAIAIGTALAVEK